MDFPHQYKQNKSIRYVTCEKTKYHFYTVVNNTFKIIVDTDIDTEKYRRRYPYFDIDTIAVISEICKDIFGVECTVFSAMVSHCR